LKVWRNKLERSSVSNIIWTVKHLQHTMPVCSCQISTNEPRVVTFYVEEHVSLLSHITNYYRKKFYNFGSWKAAQSLTVIDLGPMA
jgi:hypothetical protein